MSKVSFEFQNFKPADKAVFASNVIVNMTGNAYFTTIQEQVVTLKTLYDAYSVAAADAIHGGTDRILTRDNRMDALQFQLVAVGQYVQIISKGLDAIILSSGYSIYKPTKVSREITVPTGFKVINDDRNGLIVASWDFMAGAVNYGLEIMEEDGVWKNGQYPTTCKKNVLGAFRQGSFVQVRIRANGAGGVVSGWTQAIGVWVS